MNPTEVTIIITTIIMNITTVEIITTTIVQNEGSLSFNFETRRQKSFRVGQRAGSGLFRV